MTLTVSERSAAITRFLLSCGCSLWCRHGQRRVYINRDEAARILESGFGFRLEFRRSVKPVRAVRHGVPFPSHAAARLLDWLDGAFFDLTDGTFHGLGSFGFRYLNPYDLAHVQIRSTAVTEKLKTEEEKQQ